MAAAIGILVGIAFVAVYAAVLFKLDLNDAQRNLRAERLRIAQLKGVYASLEANLEIGRASCRERV